MSRRCKLHFRDKYGTTQFTGFGTMWEDGTYTMSWRSFKASVKWLYDRGVSALCKEGSVDVYEPDSMAYHVSIPKGDFDVD